MKLKDGCVMKHVGRNYYQDGELALRYEILFCF